MGPRLEKTEKDFSINAPFGRIAGLTWGNPSNTPVLLGHGKLHSACTFRPLVFLLPDCFFYVAVEFPGNGRSDHFPGGFPYTIMDLVQTIVQTRLHFKWDKFIYIGHSLGALIGKYYNIAYPGHITRVVELDPAPAYRAFEMDEMKPWYQHFYASYYEKYSKFNAGIETAPKYSYEKAQEMLISNGDLTRKAAELVMERSIEPAGDGLYRFTYDQRMKEVPFLPLGKESLRQLYTMSDTPTLCVLAGDVVRSGSYDGLPFVMDEDAWPNRNFKYIVVPGGHNVHVCNAECMAGDISKFLLDGNGIKAKL